jgi:hypothetical protein
MLWKGHAIDWRPGNKTVGSNCTLIVKSIVPHDNEDGKNTQVYESVWREGRKLYLNELEYELEM